MNPLSPSQAHPLSVDSPAELGGGRGAAAVAGHVHGVAPLVAASQALEPALEAVLPRP